MGIRIYILISEILLEEAASERGEAKTEGDEGRVMRPFLTPLDCHLVFLTISLSHFPFSSFFLGTHSSKVYLEIDNRQCVQDSDQCFKNTDAAAALLASHAIQGTLSYPLVSVDSELHTVKGKVWGAGSVTWGKEKRAHLSMCSSVFQG